MGAAAKTGERHIAGRVTGCAMISLDGSGSPRMISRAAFCCFHSADQIHGDFARVWSASMLVQINPLPSSQGEPARP